jgi:hypothetical protein
VAQPDAPSELPSLQREREEVEAWLDGPAKKATLTALDRRIAEQERNEQAA